MKKLHNKISVAGALCALLLLLFTSCEQTAEPDLNRVGWAYYPLSEGQYRVYDVYRINYNFLTDNDTLSYELKEVVSEYYLNQRNDTVYVLRRFQRSTQAAPWQLDSAYLIQRTPRWLIQTVNNRPQVHLAFPVAEGLSWNGNMLNADDKDDFIMLNVGRPYELEDKTYENTLKVVQHDLLDVIDRTDQRQEIYAIGVGMIYKRTNTLKYCSKDCGGRVGSITDGLFLEMKLKETGKEPL